MHFLIMDLEVDNDREVLDWALVHGEVYFLEEDKEDLEGVITSEAVTTGIME